MVREPQSISAGPSSSGLVDMGGGWRIRPKHRLQPGVEPDGCGPRGGRECTRCPVLFQPGVPSSLGPKPNVKTKSLHFRCPTWLKEQLTWPPSVFKHLCLRGNRSRAGTKQILICRLKIRCILNLFF